MLNASRLQILAEHGCHEVYGVIVALNPTMKCLWSRNQHIVLKLPERRSKRGFSIHQVKRGTSNGKSAQFVVVPKKERTCNGEKDASTVSMGATI
jgi:hypothetical protein